MPKKFIIRAAAIRDIPAIIALYKKLMAQHSRYDPLYRVHRKAYAQYGAFLKRCIRNPSARVLVAEHDGRIAAFVSAKIDPRLFIFAVRAACYIYDIFIDTRSQSRGIGSALFKELLTWARKRRVRYIKLEVSPRNPKAFAFWEKMGFHIFQHKMARKISPAGINH